MDDDSQVKENISKFFDKESKSMQNRHEELGIPESMRFQVSAITEANVQKALDVGSGPGSLIIELLKGGTKHAIGLDLSEDMNKIAKRRIEEENLQDRVTLYKGSFLEFNLDEKPDAISLHRVICCHPDREGMIKQSVAYKPKIITLSIPREWKIFRFFLAIGGAIAKLRKSFRPYIHSQKTIDKQLQEENYHLISRQKKRWWISSTYEYRP